MREFLYLYKNFEENSTMKTKFIFFLLLFLSIINAQTISGKIVSSENNQIIPYARIGIEDEKIGTIADENGNYKIDLTNIDQSKKIVVQVGGYISFVQKIQDFINSNNHNITLKEKITEISEVIITPKNYVNKNLGVNSKSKKMQFMYSSNGGSNENWYRELAILFSNNKKLKIERINVNIADFKTDKPLILNFNIYSLKDKQPDQSILSENLTVELTEDKIKDGTFTFDLSEKSIWINKEDFFVSMQIMNGFNGKIGFSAALFRTVYERSYYSNWEKITMASPAMNVDVKIEK